MPTYRKEDAEKEVGPVLAAVLKDIYPELLEAEITIGLLFADATRDESGEPKGPALKLHGYPATAVIKVNSLKDRVEGKPDCTIQVDGDAWPKLSDEERRALIDHECQHIEILVDDDGNIKSDDAGRPKMRLRPHDFQLGGFDSVIDRHGRAALEAQAALDLNRRLTQRDFAWG